MFLVILCRRKDCQGKMGKWESIPGRVETRPAAQKMTMMRTVMKPMAKALVFVQ